MKLSTVPRAYRNLRRFRDIAAVLRRYGLADWLSRYSLPFRDWAKDSDGVSLSRFSRNERVRMALTELGPTFIKLGQLLASRPDIVGPELADELKDLRASVRPEPFDAIHATLRKELGDDFMVAFADINPEPLACASIGQVHRGILSDGTRVVLKIQRSDIAKTVHEDIEILMGIAPLASHLDSFSAWSPVEMVDSLAPIIRRELDFRLEQRNLTAIGNALNRRMPDVVIPKPVDALCSSRVLVMEEIEGTPLSQWLTADPPEDDRQRLGETMAKAYLHMVFDESNFHADPHMGNLQVTSDGKLVMLDFGMVGRIDGNLRETLQSILAAVATGDEQRLIRSIRRIGRPPATLDDAKFRIDVVDFVTNYGHQPLGAFRINDALHDLSNILHEHRIKLPHQSALLLKMLMTLGGTLGELRVDFNSLDAVEDFVRRQMLRRLSPGRQWKQINRLFNEAEHFLETAPDEMLSLIGQVRRGEASVQLQHRRLGPTINRLVLGLMSSAVFLGSAIMLATNAPPRVFTDDPEAVLHNISLPGVVGVIGSISVMLWLLIAITRSGQLVKDD